MKATPSFIFNKDESHPLFQTSIRMKATSSFIFTLAFLLLPFLDAAGNFSFEMDFKTITPKQFVERARGGEDLLLIDVREPEEYELARVEGARLLPLSLFNEWAPTLDPERETVFICHHGIRSAQVCGYLSRQGFTKTYNLSGGIDRWSTEVDPSIPRY
jgi:rhodanese-related sulfurtransferase